jgi:hypothetical protein
MMDVGMTVNNNGNNKMKGNAGAPSLKHNETTLPVWIVGQVTSLRHPE